jgi:Spy/CpxP family protein refolding chaperone
LHANLSKAELALEPLVRDDQPNESAILAQIDKVAQARAELEKANARYLLALRSKLTPEPRTRWARRRWIRARWTWRARTRWTRAGRRQRPERSPPGAWTTGHVGR